MLLAMLDPEREYRSPANVIVLRPDLAGQSLTDDRGYPFRSNNIAPANG